MKSLYFNLAYVFLFSAKTQIYKQNTHMHKVELKTLYFKFVWLLQNRLSVSRTVSHLIMRVNKSTVAYRIVQLSLSTNEQRFYLYARAFLICSEMSWITVVYENA